METASLIVGALAVVAKSVTGLKELSEKYKLGEQSIELLISKLSTVRAALAQLQLFLEPRGNHRLITPQLHSALESAIRPIHAILSVIDQHISQIQAGWINRRLRYVWDEDVIKEHSNHLDSQISALNLLLQVIQL